MCQKSGLEGDTPEDRLRKLRVMDPLEVLGKYTTAALGPMGDDVVLPRSWTFEQSNPTRCRSLIIGDTNVEGIILDGLARRTPPSHFERLLRSFLPEVDKGDFCRVFGFSGDDEQPWECHRDFVRRFTSIMMFQFPNIRIAETFSGAGGGQACLYHFEEPSPYAGPTYGLSYHGQCALYMYGIQNDELPPDSQQVAETMSRMWAAFAYDVRPWEPYMKAGKFMRFGPEGQTGLKDPSTDETRRYEYISWLREHFEPMKQLTQALLGGE